MRASRHASQTATPLLPRPACACSGPVSEVLPHFEVVGFVCPVRKDPGSFLQEITTPLGQMLYAKPELLEAHGVAPEAQDAAKLLGAPPKDLILEISEMTGV